MHALKHLLGLDGGRRTVRPLRAHAGAQQAALSEFSRATLGSGDVAGAVKLPEGADAREWIASNATDLFNTCALLLGLVGEGCSAASCPTMTAGRFEFRWDPSADGAPPPPPLEAAAAAAAAPPQAGPASMKPLALPAPEYMSRLLTWAGDLLSDEARFPTAPGAAWPASFAADSRLIFRRLFRIFAHIYRHHLKDFELLGAVSHLNTAYQHYYLFVLEHKLVDAKDLAPLEELNAALQEKRKANAAAAAASAAAATA